MKITALKTLVCHARMRNWIFVKVLTDQPGLWGWGEATLEWHTRAVLGAIEDLAQLLIGEDPTRVEYLWQMMYRQHFWHGSGIVRGTAISGIDLALWDIIGKIHHVPCHKLWGGPVRDYIRLYSHLGGGRMEDFYATCPSDAQRFAELAAQTVAGAARMVLTSGEHPSVLKDRVASPGGTTIAGLQALESGGLRGTLMAAVEAATRRSIELGQV